MTWGERRPSATIALAVLIGLLAVVGQWVAYGVSSTVLEESVRTREIDKVATIGSVVKGLISEHEGDAKEIASLVAANQALGQALSLNEPERSAQLKPVLDYAFKVGGTLLLEVTDTSEVVLYRAQDPKHFGDKAVGWGVEEALNGTGTTVSLSAKDGVAIQALEPVMANGKVRGIVAAGVVLNKEILEELRVEVGAHLALIGRKGMLATTQSGTAGNFDVQAVEEAFEKKIPIYRTDVGSRQTSVYLPLIIVDEAYVVLARLDSAEAYALIERGKHRSAIFAVLILLGSLALGFGVLYWVMGPLRQLRLRAEKTAMDLTGESIAANDADEVVSVVKVLDTLTERLLQRNRDLAAAKVLADAASHAKSQFLSAMSHEIRTPLNGVLGMAELLMDTQLSRDQVRFVGAIDSAGRVLHGLLSNILDLAKIEEGQVKLERIDFDPRQATLDLCSVFSEMASIRSVTLKTDVSSLNCTWASGDPTRFKQVLSNLLSNALKFTPKGEIRLRAESIPTPAGFVVGDTRCWCRFSIEDTGIGIAPEALEKLFNRFVQADLSTTRHFGGSGLGLAISKHLVELMGGRVYAESTAGQGSRFWFDVPFAAAASLRAPPALSAKNLEVKGMNILVAEDNAINQLVAKTLLTRLGANLTMVENGELAVQAVKQTAFDLVFMDCQMPVMDGFEATRQIRQWEQSQFVRRPLPIVALTANALAGDREACLEAGMTDYVTKPVTSAALALALERHRPIDFSPSVAPVPKESIPKDPEAVVFDASVLGSLPMVLDGSDIGFADEMLDLFMGDAKKSLNAIDLATHEVDFAALTRLVHTLKSSAAQVGAMALSAQAAEQESLLRKSQLGEGDWRGGLKLAFERFENAVAMHRESTLGQNSQSS